MDWMTWRLGNGRTGYYKMLLLQWKWLLKWDFYLLRWPQGSYREVHQDLIKGHRHYRINFVIWQAVRGGRFSSQKCFYNGKRLKFFRSDYPHEVDKIEEGTRYVLSFGFALKDTEGL